MVEFLKELTELSKKYGIGIGGCGCCGSPFLYDLNSGIVIGSELDLGEDLESYEVDIVASKDIHGLLH